MKPGKKNKETSVPSRENLLALFNRLTKLQTNEECEACITEMLSALTSGQPDVQSDEKSEKLEAFCSGDLCYTVRRLIKGSASINERTRRSFAATLFSVVLKFKDSIPCAVFVKEFDKLLTSQDLYGTGNPSRGQETALNSARLACISTAVEVYHGLDATAASKMLTELFEMAEIRSFLGIPCFQVLLSIKKLGEYDDKINDCLQNSKASVDLIWFLVESGISKENVAALRTFTKEPILANADLIFPLLNESISYLSEPHKLWFSMIDYAKTTGTLQEMVFKIDADYIGTDSLQKKIIGVKLMSYSFIALETLPLEKLENLLQLINQLGPKHSKGSKNALPLNQELTQLMSDLKLRLDSLTDEGVNALLRLSNLRMFPEDFKAELLKDQKVVESYFAEALKAFHEADEVHKPIQFDSLIFIAKIPSSPDSKRVELNQQLMAICFESIENASGLKLKQAMLTRFQTLLTDSLLTAPLAETLQFAVSVTSSAEYDDDVVAEGAEKIQKLLKKIEGVKVKDPSTVSLVEGYRLYLLVSQVWLSIEPLLVLDSLDDIKEAISVIKSKKKDDEEVSPVDMLVDMLMKLLSTSSNFVKKAVESIFKTIIPLLSNSSVDILIATLEADPKGNDDVLEDMEEEMGDSDEDEEEEEESEEELEAECFTGNNLPLKRNSAEPASESEEESDVFLDDADAAELEMYDKKLSEIFSHKKEAKMSSKMTAQALLHFKSRTLGLFRLILETKSGLPFDVRLYSLSCLLKVIPFNLSDKNGSIAGAIGDLIKTSSKKGPVESTELASGIFTEIFELIKATFWEKQILWSHAQCVLAYLIKIMDSNEEPSQNLIVCWNSLCASKKMQKSNFVEFFSLWAETQAQSCWSLVESEDFFSGLESLNSHSRQSALKFLKKLTSNKMASQDHLNQPFATKLLELCLKLSCEVDGIAAQRDALRSVILLLVAVLKIRPDLITKENTEIKTLAGRLDKDLKNLVDPLIR